MPGRLEVGERATACSVQLVRAQKAGGFARDSLTMDLPKANFIFRAFDPRLVHLGDINSTHLANGCGLE